MRREVVIKENGVNLEIAESLYNIVGIKAEEDIKLLKFRTNEKLIEAVKKDTESSLKVVMVNISDDLDIYIKETWDAKTDIIEEEICFMPILEKDALKKTPEEIIEYLHNKGLNFSVK